MLNVNPTLATSPPPIITAELSQLSLSDLPLLEEGASQQREDKVLTKQGRQIASRSSSEKVKTTMLMRVPRMCGFCVCVCVRGHFSWSSRHKFKGLFEG